MTLILFLVQTGHPISNMMLTVMDTVQLIFSREKMAGGQ